jgi:beta-mannosidase
MNRFVCLSTLLFACAGLVVSQAENNAGIVTRTPVTGWMFSRAGSQEWYDASVPGCVHTDLLDNGLIDDPFYRDNEQAVQWIEGEGWEYAATFAAGDDLLARENIDLVFEGLDTYATVFLNDSLVLTADNMFRTWRVPCRSLLKAGENTLRVRFAPAVGKIDETAAAVPYQLPEKRAYARKAPYQFGWDWGPRFVTAGIWRPVYLEVWDQARIKNVQIIQGPIAEASAALSAVFEIESTVDQTAVLSLDAQGSAVATEEAALTPGSNTVRVDFVIDDPELWWTNGLGEPFLYDLTATLSVDGEAVDNNRERIGLRTVEIVQEPDSAGSSFFIRLNGIPVFMKGANYIPQDNFPNRVTPEMYRDLVRSAVETNMNMLRVWGGGIYENDLFYDLCDENGVLVWQDFMFAGTMYPGDPAFVENVRREAVDNVVRLRNHPCIALWCGNNEVDNGWKDWGWQKQFGYSQRDSVALWRNYEKVFHDVLPGVVALYDPARFYWPSSPLYGWGHDENFREGDSHYWGVWWGGEPFAVYDRAVGRFMSEYGFQAYPDMATIRSFTQPGDRTIDSGVMRAHQKHRAGNQIIFDYMKRDFKVPERFEDFVYVSQLLQAEGITRAIEAHRRAMPYCMGTLYWQLNDCWPVVSWSSRDYHGRRKALHYFVKKAYNDVLVSISAAADRVGVYCVSDRKTALDARLLVRVVDFEGAVLYDNETAVALPPGSSGKYAGLEARPDFRNAVLVAELWAEDRRLSRSLYYFAPAKDLELPDPELRWVVEKEADHHTITLTAGKLAKNVYISCDTEGSFSDNYFDILPGETVAVEFRGAGPPGGVRVTSLVDTHK